MNIDATHFVQKLKKSARGGGEIDIALGPAKGDRATPLLKEKHFLNWERGSETIVAGKKGVISGREKRVTGSETDADFRKKGRRNKWAKKG